MNADNEGPGPPENRLWQPVTIGWFVAIFGTALFYSILRYHIAGGVGWNHFPLFILNKATSLAAVVFVACAYLVGRVVRWYDNDPKLKLVVIRFCGLTGFSLAAIHALFSVSLLTPAYFAKFFDADGRLKLEGELGVALGVVALWAVAIPAITTLPMMPNVIGSMRWKRCQRMGYLCLGLVVGHMVAFGLEGWLAPEKWQWRLPPISLLAAVVAAVPLLGKLYSLSERRQR